MKIRQLYKKGKEILINSKEASFDEFCPDVKLIMQKCFNLSSTQLVINANEEAKEVYEKDFLEKIKLRASGYPLQYILGEWEFMDINLKIREGVLIPREDTASVVKAVLEKIKPDENLNILDLCAGSGAICIALAKNIKNAKIYAVELFDEPFNCLKENIKNTQQQSKIIPIKADVLDKLNFKAQYFDVIISNPPYIKSKEIKTLQKEVTFEPVKALDGGKNGLNFYKYILKNHLVFLKKGGLVAFEFGDGQLENLRQLFDENNIDCLEVKYDLANNPRAIIGKNIKP